MKNRFKFRFWFKDTQEMIYSEKFNDVQTLVYDSKLLKEVQ